ncbi:MAG TPA: DsbA family protein [Candidatus Eisenbacteria bacterium]|nr:DsbA family protein [Candidatus Eisenbacteria bacterium]
MTVRVLFLAFAGLIAACSGPEQEAPPPTTTTTKVLSAQDLIAIEATPASTPPLPHGVEPATMPVAGLKGTPGPSPAFGPENAPVRIFVFSDFQCPVCRRVVEPLKLLARTYPNDVRIVFKENALAMHGRASRLAAASLAAFRQGKFWEFHDRVFANPGQLDDDSLAAHAKAIGLDVPRFQADMDDPAVTAQVEYEADLAASLDLRSTPGFMINGTPQMGWGSYMGMEGLVKRELDRAQKLSQSGTPADRVAYEATRQAGPKGEEIAMALFVVPK